MSANVALRSELTGGSSDGEGTRRLIRPGGRFPEPRKERVHVQTEFDRPRACRTCRRDHGIAGRREPGRLHLGGAPVPMLSAEHEVDPRGATAISRPDAARELVMSHLRLVVSVARRYLGYGCRTPPDPGRQHRPDEGRQALLTPSAGCGSCRSRCTGSRPRSTRHILKNWRMVKVATTRPLRAVFNLHSTQERRTRSTSRSMRLRAMNVRDKDVIEMEPISAGKTWRSTASDDGGRATPRRAALALRAHAGAGSARIRPSAERRHRPRAR